MKQYSFLNEANWAKLGANAIGSLGQNAIRKGAGYGAVTGAVVGAYRNKKRGGSAIGGAFKGAGAGAALGAVGGLGVKKLASSGVARELQGDLINKAKAFDPKLIATTTAKGNTMLHSTQQAADAWTRKGQPLLQAAHTAGQAVGVAKRGGKTMVQAADGAMKGVASGAGKIARGAKNTAKGVAKYVDDVAQTAIDSYNNKNS